MNDVACHALQQLATIMPSRKLYCSMHVSVPILNMADRQMTFVFVDEQHV